MINFNYNYSPLDESCLQIAFSTGILAIFVILTQSITIAPVEVSFVDLENGRFSLLFVHRTHWRKKIQEKNCRELILISE